MKDAMKEFMLKHNPEGYREILMAEIALTSKKGESRDEAFDELVRKKAEAFEEAISNFYIDTMARRRNGSPSHYHMGMVVKKYARIDTFTGKAMDEGWVIGDGENYCADEATALQIARAMGFSDIDEAYKAEAMYWTNWEGEDKPIFELADGRIVDSEEEPAIDVDDYLLAMSRGSEDKAKLAENLTSMKLILSEEQQKRQAQAQAAIHAVAEQYSDVVFAIIWSLDDYVGKANEIMGYDDEMTAEEEAAHVPDKLIAMDNCIDAMHTTHRHHDCNYGVTWEHLESELHNQIEGHESGN